MLHVLTRGLVGHYLDLRVSLGHFGPWVWFRPWLVEPRLGRVKGYFTHCGRDYDLGF